MSGRGAAGDLRARRDDMEESEPHDDDARGAPDPGDAKEHGQP
jgi:hypothetical protein